MEKLSLKDSVSVALNSLEAGVATKQQAKESILAAAGREKSKESPKAPPVCTSGDLLISMLELLHKEFGICFEVGGGKLQSVYIEEEPLHGLAKAFESFRASVLEGVGIIYG